MEERQGQILGKVMTFLLLVSMLLVVKESAAYVNVLTQKEIVQTQKTIVIDPGHGGNDPGKVGINQALEKDVNLEIALKLKKYLEQQDIHVVMTRQEDKGLYEETDTNKKVKDMKQRLSIMEQSKPALVVSVHQNSYPEESIRGVQVFYYRDQSGREKGCTADAGTDDRDSPACKEKRSQGEQYLLHSEENHSTDHYCGVWFLIKQYGSGTFGDS